MKKNLIGKLAWTCFLVWAMVIIGTLAEASEVTINWDYPIANESNISSFKICKLVPNGKIEKLTDIAVTARTATFEDDIDPQCSNYVVVAVDADQQNESFASNVAASCPDEVLPPIYVRPEAPTNATVTVIVQLLQVPVQQTATQ
jgi:hypothetical protein